MSGEISNKPLKTIPFTIAGFFYYDPEKRFTSWKLQGDGFGIV